MPLHNLFPSECSVAADPQTGARIIQWTRGPAKNQHLYFTSPSVTADDRWLTFISDRDGNPNLYAIDRRDGTFRQLSDNSNGLLRGYVYPQGGRKGLAKASPCLDAGRNQLYYIRNDAVYAISLEAPQAGERHVCDLPVGWYTAFTHISPDGQTLCVPIADPRAFAQPMQTQWEQLRRVPDLMQAGRMATRILLIDTASGGTRTLAAVPFWATHVQFDPAGSGRIILNKEGQCPETGIPLPDRVWCLETDGSFRPIASEAQGEWRSHENWSPDGRSIVYHGCRDGMPFVAARSWDGGLLHEASLEGIALYHAIGTNDGRRLLIDKHDGFIAMVDPAARRDRVVNLCRHDTSMNDQDTHAHPIMTPTGRGVIFTSDRDGNCNVYEVMLVCGSA